VRNTGFDARAFLATEVDSSGFADAFAGWDELLRALIRAVEPDVALEVGGGKGPVSRRLVEQHPGVEFIVNDISPDELIGVGEPLRASVFDVADPSAVPEDLLGSVDLVFSKFVLEHVSSTDRAMQSTHDLLREGGVGVHFFPTLWASPFVVNKLVPFELTKPIVDRFSGRRRKNRFPAMYRQTTSSEAQLDRWRRIGFRQVEAARFYGHRYYDRVPVVRQVEDFVTRHASRRSWTWYSSYAYVLLVK
jgi:SAM-dependent methyltransferase